jgi:hypothetical protein
MLFSFLSSCAPNLEVLISVTSEDVPEGAIQELKLALPLLEVITESVQQLIHAGKYDLVRKYCAMGLIKAQVNNCTAKVPVTPPADGLNNEELRQRVEELIEHGASDDAWLYEYVRIRQLIGGLFVL